MISVNVKLFAMVRDLVGSGEVELSLPDRSSTTAFMSALVLQFPQLEEWRPHVRIAVNSEYVGEDRALEEGDESALIPPVSGG